MPYSRGYVAYLNGTFCSGSLCRMATTVGEVARGGRRAEAARNDERILEAARAVFIADPGAAISAVAAHAGVGVGALYRRYPSKEEMLRRLCADGLQRFIDAAEAALADHGDPWQAFAGFMRRCVDADTNSLTQRLAGTFTPTQELYREAGRAQGLLTALFDRTRAAGAIREDLEVNDVALLLEQVAAIRVGGDERTLELRHRYLALTLDAMRAPAGELPGPAPGWEELAARWNP
jgi:AcrR family transcriptional regulator